MTCHVSYCDINCVTILKLYCITLCKILVHSAVVWLCICERTHLYTVLSLYFHMYFHMYDSTNNALHIDSYAQYKPKMHTLSKLIHKVNVYILEPGYYNKFLICLCKL